MTESHTQTAQRPEAGSCTTDKHEAKQEGSCSTDKAQKTAAEKGSCSSSEAKQGSCG